MNILMFFPGRIQHLPPMISAALNLSKLGYSVQILAFSSLDVINNALLGSNIVLNLVSKSHPNSIMSKIYMWMKGLFFLYYFLFKIKPDYVWYHQCHFSVWYAVLGKILFKHNIIMHSHELTCHVWWRWYWQKKLAKMSHSIIVPEKNRGWILSKFSNTNANIYEICNNNYTNFSFDSQIDKAKIISFFKEKGGSIFCNKFIIYQGAILENRSLKEIVLAFMGVNNPEIGLIIMGELNDFSNILRKIAKEDNRIIFSSYIQPPKHLDITKMCFAGVLLYKPISLNSIYCAPNKLYEYTSLGLGVIMPDYPGVERINSEFKIGVLCDPTSVSSIKNAIIKIINMNEFDLCKNSLNFYNCSCNVSESYRDFSNAIFKSS